jgi:hypothetical protein
VDFGFVPDMHVVLSQTVKVMAEGKWNPAAPTPAAFRKNVSSLFGFVTTNKGTLFP